MLQLSIAKLLPHIPDAPAVDIEPDGIIGPSITLAVQVIAQRLANGPHQGLVPFAALQPEEAIPAVAENAMEIAGYLDAVLTKDPTALVAPRQPEPEDPIQMLKGLFTPKRIVAAVGTIAGLGAFALVGAAIDRRSLGLVDRTPQLPPSDGTDEFENDEHDEAEVDEVEEPATTHDIDTDNVIDAEAVEVPDHAA